jgi:hypothetical protein
VSTQDASPIDRLATLFRETGEAHHVAYRETDGADPDWSIWYADYLLQHGIDSILDASILKSDLIYLLICADRDRSSRAPGGRWERLYARFFVERYLG